MRWALILAGSLAAALGATTWAGHGLSQERARPAKEAPIEREKLSLAGWDPDEPVPAYVYYKKGNRAMPVVIFMHGLGGSQLLPLFACLAFVCFVCFVVHPLLGVVLRSAVVLTQTSSTGSAA